MIGMILMVFSFVLSCLAALGIGAPRLHLGWAAFALFVLAHLLTGGAVLR